MEYRNSKIPERINTSERHPLHDLLVLLAGVLAFTIIAVIVLSISADYMVRQIPLSVEQQWTADFFEDSDDPRVDAYLNQLAAEIAPMFQGNQAHQFHVHYSDTDVINAFAYLGGHITITRGLLLALNSENALAMVLAHEMAHVAERHPLRNLGRGLVIAAFLAAVTGIGNDWLGMNVVGETSMLTTFKFSRDHEEVADELALKTLHARYGHRGGADDLFLALMGGKAPQSKEPPEFFSTHPATARRLRAARANAPDDAANNLKPLPASLSQWLEQAPCARLPSSRDKHAFSAGCSSEPAIR